MRFLAWLLYSMDQASNLFFPAPKSVIAGKSPPRAAFEQAAAALAARCLGPAGLVSFGHDDEEEGAESTPSPSKISGGEVWCQCYDGGRSLAPHYDKDEHALIASNGAIMRHPAIATVSYLTDGGRGGENGADVTTELGPTCVLAQTLHPRTLAPVPAAGPSSLALAYPRTGAAIAFDGRRAHSVLSSPPAAPRRVALAINFWKGQPPANVLRVTQDDVAAAALAAPLPACELEGGPAATIQPALRARLPPPPVGGGAVRVADLMSGGKGPTRPRVLHFDGVTGWELVEAESEAGGEPVFVAGGASSSESD